MPYEEEEDRGCEVKCPKGGGGCGIRSTPILLPILKLPSGYAFSVIPRVIKGTCVAVYKTNKCIGPRRRTHNNRIIGYIQVLWSSCGDRWRNSVVILNRSSLRVSAVMQVCLFSIGACASNVCVTTTSKRVGGVSFVPVRAYRFQKSGNQGTTWVRR